MGQHDDVAVLVGNGLSIAFNPELELRSITEEVMRRIETADGDDVVAAMKEIAENALPDGVTSAEDFEHLVGAFGTESRTLGTLETLATLTSPMDEELRDAIRRVASFAGQVRDNGVSHVLEVICERTHAEFEKAAELHALVTAILKAFPGKVAFGNLNYDTLLLAALLHVCQDRQVADLADGRKSVRVAFDDNRTREVKALRRTAADFPIDWRVNLLHLHGSLTYWENKQENIYAKIPKEILDDEEQWRAVRERTTNVRPTVVLANPRDKAQHVREYPYNLAYEVFGAGLDSATHWIVIGYSFRDEPINRMLSARFLDLQEKATVLVVTHGPVPTDVEIHRAFGWGADDGDPSSWLTVCRTGANGLQDTPEWRAYLA
ncbi:SIR2 family protein [Clavibacter sp. VKM Ac-2872]|uniref:SIR2 family protein n=1 Tax=Clavibacter sp. VKM Ac-2872 TaxID=2783812 RepID=UPI00188BC102|nr:SIR2 family protein [Clavibacter sp. VKM Ac-2872]MBF4622699.1 SIR2 family protein [Clavibacter sp. VKM Ac-2872]